MLFWELSKNQGENTSGCLSSSHFHSLQSYLSPAPTHTIDEGSKAKKLPILGFPTRKDKQSPFPCSQSSLLSPPWRRSPRFPAQSPRITPVSMQSREQRNFGAGLLALNTRANSTHFGEEGKEPPMGCVPPLHRSSQPPAQFGDSSRGPSHRGERAGIGRYLLPFPKMPRTALHGCGMCVKLPAPVTHTHGSAPAWEAPSAPALPPNYPPGF